MEKAGPARLLIKAVYVVTAEAAGTRKLKTYVMANIKIKKGDLLPWFIYDHAELPAWYLEDCKKFFESLNNGKH
jgi:hypothetical protein